MEQTAYEKLEQEIEVMKSNQAQNLKDYGKRVSTLGEEVAKLKDTKNKLEAEVKALGQGKDEITNKLRAEAKEAKEQAKSLLADVKNEEKALDERKKDFEKRASKEKMDLDNKNIKLAERESVIRSDETNVNQDKVDISNRFKEVEDALYDARDYSKSMEEGKARVAKKEYKLEAIILVSEEDQRKLDVKNKDADALKIELKALIQENKDTLSKIKADQEELDKEKGHQYVVESEAKSNYEKKLKVLQDQQEANGIRSLELDAGFSKLKEETESTNKQIRKLEEIKKQLSK